MADKKNDKELSVEDRLKGLYQLQQYLSQLDKIKVLRGELPLEVKDLEDDVVRFQTRIQKHKDEIADLQQFIGAKRHDIDVRREKIERYKEQSDNVRNNREFAFLEKEMEFEHLEIELAEKNIRDASAKIESKTAEIEKAEESLSDSEHILEEKRKELDAITQETRQEEENILAKAKDLEKKFDGDESAQRLLSAFKRIRKNTRNGLGIVTVQRDACGGCFNRIAPQRRLEIKMHKKVIVCEYCGRIIVDGAMVGEAEPTVEAPAKPTKRSSKRES